MVIDTSTRRSRRALLAGVLGGLGALAASAISRVTPVLAAGDDGAPMVVGGFYPDARNQTTLANNTTSEKVLWVASNPGQGHGDADAVTGYSHSGTGLTGISDQGLGVAGDSGSWIGVSGKSTSSIGVLGSSDTGVGGQFKGGKAQLRLEPKATAGRPTSGTHSKGEIYMDSKGAIFICTGAGTPGKWRKISTISA